MELCRLYIYHTPPSWYKAGPDLKRIRNSANKLNADSNSTNKLNADLKSTKKLNAESNSTNRLNADSNSTDKLNANSNATKKLKADSNSANKLGQVKQQLRKNTPKGSTPPTSAESGAEVLPTCTSLVRHDGSFGEFLN